MHYFSTQDNDILRRNDKFALLNDIAHNGLDSIKWQTFTLESPYFWFVPKDFDNAEYENFWAFASDKALGESKAIFKNYGSGSSALKDKVCIHFDKESVLKTIDDFLEMQAKDIRKKYKLPEIDSRDWKVEWAKADILANVDCYESANTDSRNGEVPTIVSEAKQSIENKITHIVLLTYAILSLQTQVRDFGGHHQVYQNTF